MSYSAACKMASIKTLFVRRVDRCLDFSIKCSQEPYRSWFFPRNPNIDLRREAGNGELFNVNFSRILQYKNSAIPFCQRLLDDYYSKEGEEKVEGGQGEG